MPDGFDASSPNTACEVLAGLSQRQKTLPAKLFYDDEGCRLFGEITRLPEYYLTRTEQALLGKVASELPCVPGCALVEYGASDEAKALRLIDPLGAASYVPIDIAKGALHDMVGRLRVSRPTLRVHPVATDFLLTLELPDAIVGQACFGFFPGSTIGNLDRPTAHRFLRQVRDTLGKRAYFLVGADLRKDAATLLPAYDDAQGITAAFNKNILTHINRITGSDFDVDRFSHRAVWNEAEGRIEMHLVSQGDQQVTLDGSTLAFRDGETIHTENSYKLSVVEFQAMARGAGWRPHAVWTDPRNLYSIHLLASD